VMKRYECRFVAALVFGLLPCLTMCYPRIPRAPNSPTTGRRGHAFARQNAVNNQMQCTEFKSSFLRSGCGNYGYLTVHRNRVLVQTSGLSTNHPEAEFVIESCSRPKADYWFSSSRSSYSESLVRYRHSSSNKYICFKRNGAVRAVSAKHVEGRGLLCLFRQVAVETRSPYEEKTYHRIQSAYNSKWHLGFQHKTVPLAERRPHRGALSRSWTRRRFNVHKCDFKFHSGDYRPTNDITFSGLDDLVREHHPPSPFNTYPHSKAAINGEADTINNVSKEDTEKVSDTKISKGYKERLLQQQVLKRMNQRRKIRHSRHKRPRPSRAEKNGLKKAFKRKQPMTMSKTQNFV